jgi:hypothetical protein
MPRWMSKAHFFDLEKEWSSFQAHLRKGCDTSRVPFMAPDLPPHFVERPREFEALKRLLLTAEGGQPVAITTALAGAGGFGKTTLAAALCQDDVVGLEPGVTEDLVRRLGCSYQHQDRDPCRRQPRERATWATTAIPKKPVVRAIVCLPASATGEGIPDSTHPPADVRWIQGRCVRLSAERRQPDRHLSEIRQVHRGLGFRG